MVLLGRDNLTCGPLNPNGRRKYDPHESHTSKHARLEKDMVSPFACPADYEERHFACCKN
jgi:hypothetical protein